MRRRLTAQEKVLWERVAATVTPIRPVPPREPLPDAIMAPIKQPPRFTKPVKAVGAPPLTQGALPHPEERPRPLNARTLDAGWDRRLATGQLAPDFTLDLHGCTLDTAHARLDHGLALAIAQGARVVLLITGRPRPSDDHASRSERRGAIRAKFMDWLAAGSHASKIAAIRPAHPRHGGAGAVYIVLRRVK